MLLIKNQLKKFHLKKRKSIIEKIEDIEILRFFDVDEKIKMVKLNSNSVAVDEIRDVKKAEKLLKKKIKIIMKIILVTGAAGFIGSKLCLKLYLKGFKVIACDDFSNGKKLI